MKKFNRNIQCVDESIVNQRKSEVDRRILSDLKNISSKLEDLSDAIEESSGEAYSEFEKVVGSEFYTNLLMTIHDIKDTIRRLRR